MIRILLCCGGGFSSSALVSRVKKEILENNLQNDYYIEFSPFSFVLEKISEFDIVVCCPHLKFNVDKFLKESIVEKPIYILPPIMYGMIQFNELSLDIIDAIQLYKKNKSNPVQFPGEENVHRITRSVAFRKTPVGVSFSI